MRVNVNRILRRKERLKEKRIQHLRAKYALEKMELVVNQMRENDCPLCKVRAGS